MRSEAVSEEMSAVVNEYRARHREQPTLRVQRERHVVVEEYAQPDQYESVLRELTSDVGASADILRRRPPELGGLAPALALYGAMARRGVRVRALYPRALLAVPRNAGYLREVSEAGVTVRLLEHVPHDLLVLDRHTVCLSDESAEAAEATGGTAALVRVGGALFGRSFTAVYESYWLHATPLSRAPGRPRHPRLTEQERAVIRLMAGGYSDDRIAVKLGIATEAVQKVMTTLMRRLDAGTRFEVGYKLAREVGSAEL